MKVELAGSNPAGSIILEAFKFNEIVYNSHSLEEK